MKQIGRRVRPLNWERITSGRFEYAGDMAVEGLLVGRILRSPHAHAHILDLDVTAARTMPGVHAVITHDDFAPGTTYMHEGYGDRAPFAIDKVHFVGQEVAAVAAETVAQADAALRAIRVKYRPLPASFTIDAALAEKAPTLHQRKTDIANVVKHYVRRWGDAQGGRARSQVTVEGTYWYPQITHCCMETNATVASWDETTGILHLWTGTQAPMFTVLELAHLLGLERDKIICHEIGIGGGFGSKSRISEHEAAAARLSQVTRRPVRVALTRAEEFATTKSRHAFRTELQLHADNDGWIRALFGRITCDNGSFVHSGPSVMTSGPKALGTLYRAEGIEVEARLVDTCKQPGGQFRGYGTSQATYALECLMDVLAERLQIDPIEIRKRNANLPFSTAVQGARMQTVRLNECLDSVRKALDWDRKKREKRPGRGLGVAAGFHSSGTYAMPDSNRNDGAIDIFADGRVRVRFGGADTGTGQKTILAQIAAEELGVDAEKVDVLSIESDQTPFDMGAWGSRGTFYSGNAMRKTAMEAAQRLKTLAARHLGNEAIVLEDGMARSGDRSVTLGDLVGLSPDTVDGVLTTETSFVETGVEMLNPDTGQGNFSATYSFAAHAAEIEVDVRTGRVRVIDFVAAHDVGTALNPTLLEGQIVGGAVMGLGTALSEELIHEQGRLINPAYINYALPRAADLPEIRPILVEGGDPKGPYGAKGVGELCSTPPPPAIANAIFDAVGIRLRNLPFTPDKIMTALAEKEGRHRDFQLWKRPSRWWIALVRAAYPKGLFKLLHRWGPPLRPHPEPRPIASVEMPTDMPAALRALGPESIPIGGGTDILPSREQGLIAPEHLVSLLTIPEMQGVTIHDNGEIDIGAAATLADVATALAQQCPIVAEAIATIATPQIRIMATVGGNLLQGKRCWFYRNGFDCYKRSGAASPCYAILGDHRFYHAAIDGHRCQAVTPSDLATALIALDATAEIVSQNGRRTVAMSALYTGPGETQLGPGEIVSRISIPANAGRQGTFLKLGLWQGDFAIVSIAATVTIDQAGNWQSPRLIFGGLAPTPWRARRTEGQLTGTRPTVASMRQLLDLELNGAAHPLPRNGWKLDAAAGLAEHAIERLTGQNGTAGLQSTTLH